MHRIATLAPPVSPRAAAPPRPRRGALMAVVAVAATLTGASASTPASGQVPSGVAPELTQTAGQLLELARGVSPAKLKMIEEEGYICFMAFHRVPPGISWVCVPPLR